MEVAYRLCHLPLKENSRKVVFLNTARLEKRTRLLKSRSELLELEDDSSDIFAPGIFNRYASRPDTPQFVSMTLLTLQSGMWMHEAMWQFEMNQHSLVASCRMTWDGFDLEGSKPVFESQCRQQKVIVVYCACSSVCYNLSMTSHYYVTCLVTHGCAHAQLLYHSSLCYYS